MKRAFLFLTALTLLLPGFIRAEALDFDEASRIVIQSNGRKKPLDTFAIECLQEMSGRRTLKDPATGQRRQAMEVLLSMWLNPDQWRDYPIILVANAGIARELGLEEKQRHVSLRAIKGNNAFLGMMRQVQARESRHEDLLPVEKEVGAIMARAELLEALLNGEALTITPDPSNPKGRWCPISQAAEACGKETVDCLELALKRTADAYRAGDAAAFRDGVRALVGQLRKLSPDTYPSSGVINREIHYNHLHPFRWAWVLYLAAFFLLLVPRLHSWGLGVFTAGLAFNTYGFILRCLIAGRPPVTNMYESVVWVAMGVAAFALIFELVYRSRVLVLSAAPLAVLGLIVADMLPSVLSPNIGPLPPVLRDNFWLVAHVITITSSYAAFAMATGVAHVILGHYLFSPASVGEHSPLHNLLYRVLQLGVLLLAVGTILGGVWANYAWGRFWGWDPKETWAAISLLLYIFALHGRMVRWWGWFGLSVASALCFNGILMAWYGVNFVLGKGLHSYGFGGGGVEWVGSVVALDLLFVGLCSLAHAKSGAGCESTASAWRKRRRHESGACHRQ
jgi:cytochrome c-type biogenesis protein CcsB